MLAVVVAVHGEALPEPVVLVEELMEQQAMQQLLTERHTLEAAVAETGLLQEAAHLE
jgi:hypothetical protein